MLKKSLVAICCLGFLEANTTNADAKFVLRNLPKEILVKDSLDDVIKNIRNRDTITAREAYDFITDIRRSERNVFVLDIYDILRSFLKVQPNDMLSSKLVNKIETLIESLKWLVTAMQKNEGSSFYAKSDYLTRLLEINTFIHLSFPQMKFCLEKAEKMKAGFEISTINNENGPEDGPDIFSPRLYLTKEIADAKELINEIEKLVSRADSFSQNLSLLSKDGLILRIEGLTSFIRDIKKKEFSINKKTFPISKSIIQHIRKVSGLSMNMLNSALLKK